MSGVLFVSTYKRIGRVFSPQGGYDCWGVFVSVGATDDGSACAILTQALWLSRASPTALPRAESTSHACAHVQLRTTRLRGARGQGETPETKRRITVSCHCQTCRHSRQIHSGDGTQVTKERSAEGKRNPRSMCVVYSRSGFRNNRDIVILSSPGSRAHVSVCALLHVYVYVCRYVACACVREKTKNQLWWQVAILNGSHRVGYPRYFWQSQSWFGAFSSRSQRQREAQR